MSLLARLSVKSLKQSRIILVPKPHILNYNQALTQIKPKKRALLSYLVQPILDELEGRKTVRFSSDGIVLSWAKTLNGLGYSVDIINWDDVQFEPNVSYDLLVFHGALNFEHLKKFEKLFHYIIYFSTGSYWKFHNKQENQRFLDFYKRHGVKLTRDRYINVPEEEAYKFADAIIALGDPSMADTYPFDNTLTINNGSYPDNHYDNVQKDYKSSRNNFLYFAGSGNIHKGLDLLIDSFKDLKEHLYIVSKLDKKVIDIFAREIQQPNIHVVGEVNMRTKEFYDAMDICAFAILPSCSEGQAGSIVECMNQGLIPIVSKETRLNAKNYGAVLEASNIPEIKKCVRSMAQIPEYKLANMSHKVRSVAIKEHSVEHFTRTLEKHIKTVTGTDKT